jgi:hypothetical protein
MIEELQSVSEQIITVLNSKDEVLNTDDIHAEDDDTKKLLLNAYNNSRLLHQSLINYFDNCESDIIYIMDTLRGKYIFDAKKQAHKDKQLISLFDEIKAMLST